jgi:hypothetical protein
MSHTVTIRRVSVCMSEAGTGECPFRPNEALADFIAAHLRPFQLKHEGALVLRR